MVGVGRTTAFAVPHRFHIYGRPSVFRSLLVGRTTTTLLTKRFVLVRGPLGFSTTDDGFDRGTPPHGFAGPCRYSTTGEAKCDFRQGFHPTGFQFVNDGANLGDELVFLTTIRLDHKFDLTVWVLGSKTDTPFAGLSECRLGPLTDEFPFPLCDQSQDPNGKSIHIGTITTDKIHISVLEAEEELCVSANLRHRIDREHVFFDGEVEQHAQMRENAF